MPRKRKILQRFIEDELKCCFCGGGRPAQTTEHAPPRVFFRNKVRPKGLEFPCCARCNKKFAQMDQVASFVCITMGGVLAENYNLDDPYWKKLASGVQNNCPEVISYLGLSDGEECFIESGGIERLIIRNKLDKRLFREWLNPWSAKQFFALWFHHTGTILGGSDRVWVRWITNDQLIREGVPEGLLDDISGPVGLVQGKLSSADQFLYSYSVNSNDRLGMFVLGAHNSAMVVGLIFPARMISQFDSNFREGELFTTTEFKGICPV